MPYRPLTGLTAAVHTVCAAGEEVDLSAIEAQCAHLLKNGITQAFVCGTTGEFTALSTGERLGVAQRWLDVAQGTEMRVVVHVGGNSASEACLLAQKAATGGAAAKAAMGLLGVPVGPPRLPQAALTKEQLSALERDLNQINFFSWIA